MGSQARHAGHDRDAGSRRCLGGLAPDLVHHPLYVPLAGDEIPVQFHQPWCVARLNLAAEVPASQPDRRAWILVHPLEPPHDEYPVRGSEGRHCGYRVLDSERAARLLEEVCSTWDYDYYLLNKETLQVANEAELEQVLARWLDDLEQLVQPYFCDCPI